MFGLTSLGIVHTAISLVAVGAGVVELARHGAISPARRAGRIYLATTLLTVLTGFGIFQHGGFGKPHALGVITLLVLGVAALARWTKTFGRAAAYVETLLYTLTFFFHAVPGITESLTRLPYGKPVASGPDDPLVLRWVGVSFALFVVGAALQLFALRARRGAAMKSVKTVAAVAVALALGGGANGASRGDGIERRAADVNGTHLSYLVAGAGDPVLLLHGFAETSHMWRPLITALAPSHLVIAPDLRGFGDSAKPETGYDKKSMAVDVHELVKSLGLKRVRVVGHDIGLMVAYAYAAQFPDDVDRIVLMDAFLPGVGDWRSVWLMRDLWHFHFRGEAALNLVAGRERAYLEHFWNDFAADRHHSISEADRQFYAAAYGQPGAMSAGFEVFHAFEQDAEDFARFAQRPLPMPMLVLTGEKASGATLIRQAKLVADDVEGVVIAGSGHWLMEEATDQIVPRLVAFLAGGRARRLTPADVAALLSRGAGAGSSGIAGIETRVLNGDPTRRGLYTIRLTVPAHTKIDAHVHRDERSVTVVSGTWYFGYGERADDAALEALPAGSFYVEPANSPHFAQTRDEAVVVDITGFGPTDTRR